MPIAGISVEASKDGFDELRSSYGFVVSACYSKVFLLSLEGLAGLFMID